MSSDLGLADYEFYYGVAGGGDLDFGLNSNIDAMEINGLTDQQARVSDRQFHNKFGDVPGTHLARSRLITFDLDVRQGALSDAAWRDLIDDVEGHFTVDQLPTIENELHWQFPGEEERFIRARTIKRGRIIDADSELGLTRIAIQLRAADPRVYVAAPSSDNGNTGTFNVTNNGKQNAYPIMVFDRAGGGTTVGCTNNTTGVVFSVNGLGGTGDLTGDMSKLVRGDTGLVVFRSGFNDYTFWIQPRTPFYLAPGVNNITLDDGDDVSFQWWDTFV